MAKQQTDNTTIQDLKQDIRSKTPRNLYIFHGEEMFLLRHYQAQLCKIVVDELTESFNVHRFNNENFDMQAFSDAVDNLPMMAERTLILVDDIDLFKLPEDSREKLIEVLYDIPDYCTIVFTYETVQWKPDKRIKKLWDVLNAGLIVDFAKQNQRELSVWITRHFASHGKRITPELCAYLIDITDGTMTALSGEIQKISAYSGADSICREDIDAVTEPVLDAVVFRMTDQLASGNYSQALLTLQKLFKMQQEPIAILGAIGTYFRQVAAARTLLDNGKRYGDLMELYSMRSDYPAKKAMEAARRFSPQFCADAAALLMETDYKMKTSFDEPQRLLELLILQLAGEVKHA